jgi:hypothetical protein
MSGAQCLGSMTNIYDVAGQIRMTLLELQRQVKIAQGKEATNAKGR